MHVDKVNEIPIFAQRVQLKGYLGESFHLECGQPLQTIVSSVYLFLSQKVGTIVYELVLTSSNNRKR